MSVLAYRQVHNQIHVYVYVSNLDVRPFMSIHNVFLLKELKTGSKLYFKWDHRIHFGVWKENNSTNVMPFKDAPTNRMSELIPCTLKNVVSRININVSFLQHNCLGNTEYKTLMSTRT